MFGYHNDDVFGDRAYDEVHMRVSKALRFTEAIPYYAAVVRPPRPCWPKVGYGLALVMMIRMMMRTSQGEIVQCLEGDGGLAVLVDRLQLEEPGLGEVGANHRLL